MTRDECLSFWDRRVLLHRKYCTLEQRAGGVIVKELHIQRENSMKYLPTRKKYVRGSTRPEIEIRKIKCSELMIFAMTENFPKVSKEIF